MAWDWTAFLVGGVVGVIVGGLIFTQTGRETTGRITRATGRRIARYIEPK